MICMTAAALLFATVASTLEYRSRQSESLNMPAGMQVWPVEDGRCTGLYIEHWCTMSDCVQCKTGGPKGGRCTLSRDHEGECQYEGYTTKTRDGS